MMFRFNNSVTMRSGSGAGSNYFGNIASGTAPFTLGNTGFINHNGTSSSGTLVGLEFNSTSVNMTLPTTYNSNASIDSSSTFQNVNFSTFGLVEGQYNYTMTGGQSLTVNVGAVTAVPESTSMALCGLALMFGGCTYRRPRRIFA